MRMAVLTIAVWTIVGGYLMRVAPFSVQVLGCQLGGGRSFLVQRGERRRGARPEVAIGPGRIAS